MSEYCIHCLNNHDLLCGQISFDAVQLCFYTFCATEFKGAGLDLSKPVVAMCGSGVSACWSIFAANLSSQKELALFDVSHMIVT